jgi:dTDP-3-amino-3,4,6-trideoxy-alpha-D-glucopyranose N,N-dimethyltransferase
MYEHSASLVYDRLNAARKDYRAEAGELAARIRARVADSATSLLDVGCGTGRHGEEFQQLGFDYVGVDLSPEMLAEARKRLPATKFVESDIRSLSLEDRFDAVVCLNAMIGYMLTREDLVAALRKLTEHVKPGGVLLVEPWAARDQWLAPRVSVETVEEPELVIARVSRAYFDGEFGAWEWQCAVATPDRSWSFTEVHVLGLWDLADYVNALSEAGFDATHEPMAAGRGLGMIAPRGVV